MAECQQTIVGCRTTLEKEEGVEAIPWADKFCSAANESDTPHAVPKNPLPLEESWSNNRPVNIDDSKTLKPGSCLQHGRQEINSPLFFSPGFIIEINSM